MKCVVCGNDFNEKRGLADLFRTQKYRICMKCLKEHPIDLTSKILTLSQIAT